MINDQSPEETTVVATYSTRRDAEVARDRLENENVHAFIAADDAGGAHPELQLTHGVKLVVLSGSAQGAREMLEDTGMLHERRPASVGMKRERSGDEQRENLTFSMNGLWTATAWGYLALFVLVVGAIVFGLVFSTLP